MFRNYLKTALRHLWKNKSFSALNIAGLALGMACSLLILLWVQHEKSIDAFHANTENLYVIYERQYHDGQIDAGYYTPALLSEELKKKIPEVEFAAGQAWENLYTFEAGEKILKQNGTHAGKDFFSMFSIPVLAGNKETALWCV